MVTFVVVRSFQERKKFRTPMQMVDDFQLDGEKAKFV